MSVYDLGAARVARDEALQRVDEHAQEAWKAAADDAIWFVARAQPYLSGDDVWPLLDDSGETTHERRALGARMQAARRKGYIEKAGIKQTVRESRHATDITVWRSLVYGGRA